MWPLGFPEGFGKALGLRGFRASNPPGVRSASGFGGLRTLLTPGSAPCGLSGAFFLGLKLSNAPRSGAPRHVLPRGHFLQGLRGHALGPGGWSLAGAWP